MTDSAEGQSRRTPPADVDRSPGGPTPQYHVVMVSFSGPGTAAAKLDQLRIEEALKEVEIEGEALISRDDAGEVHFHERGSAGIGATLGVATAGILGLVAGPVFLPVLLVAGAVAGGVAGHFAGQVLPPDDLREVGASLPPGSSAYVAVVDAAHAESVVEAFAPADGRVVNIPVETELSSVIREAITHRVRRV